MHKRLNPLIEKLDNNSRMPKWVHNKTGSNEKFRAIDKMNENNFNLKFQNVLIVSAINKIRSRIFLRSP